MRQNFEIIVSTPEIYNYKKSPLLSKMMKHMERICNAAYDDKLDDVFKDKTIKDDKIILEEDLDRELEISFELKNKLLKGRYNIADIIIKPTNEDLHEKLDKYYEENLACTYRVCIERVDSKEITIRAGDPKNAEDKISSMIDDGKIRFDGENSLYKVRFMNE